MTTFALGPKAFLIMYELTDPTLHRAFNEYHQLDHRPENLAQKGVAWGERWVRSPECAAVGAAPEPGARGTHYLNSYWFYAPVEESIHEFHALGERTFQAGRQFTARENTFRSFFDPVLGCAHPRIGASAAALPIRPNRGVYASIWRVAARDERAHELFRREREAHIPELLTCEGVAGAYTLASDDFYRGGEKAWVRGASEGRAGDGYRARLFYLDGDPIVCGRELYAREQALMRDAGDPAGAVELMLASPFLAITPWQWDWFEPARPAARQ